jgi:hypothetical protein
MNEAASSGDEVSVVFKATVSSAAKLNSRAGIFRATYRPADIPILQGRVIIGNISERYPDAPGMSRDVHR